MPVDSNGRVDPDDLQAAITPRTILISIMHANNEVGTIQPIEDCARIARERGILFHTDAAQTVGKIPTNVDELGVDLLSIAGHKVYAPKGIGALWLRRGVSLGLPHHPADHERRPRPGTLRALPARPPGNALAPASDLGLRARGGRFSGRSCSGGSVLLVVLNDVTRSTGSPTRSMPRLSVAWARNIGWT